MPKAANRITAPVRKFVKALSARPQWPIFSGLKREKKMDLLEPAMATVDTTALINIGKW